MKISGVARVSVSVSANNEPAAPSAIRPNAVTIGAPAAARGTAEIASAFLTNPASVEKRLQRAKKVVSQSGVLFEVSGAEPMLKQLG